MFSEQESWLARLPGSSRIAAGYELLYRLGKAYRKPAFGIDAVEVAGETVAVFEETVMRKPFCHLQRFERRGGDSSPGTESPLRTRDT